MLCRRFATAAALAVAAFPSASAGELAGAYADKAGNVHVRTSAGKDLQLSTDRSAEDVRLSPNGEAAAWLVLPRTAIDGQRWPKELRVYHRGRVRSIHCAGIIREYWFWKQGSHIATDCGGLHFAGIETLYEVASLQKVDAIDQAQVTYEQRPEWSAARDAE